MFERGFLFFSAIIWLPYGVYCFFQPGALAESAGVVATTPTAITEIRAMYGGAQIAIGSLAVAALVKPRLASGTLLALVFLTGGLASTRLMGFLIDGGGSSYTAGALGFETISVVLGLMVLRRAAPTG